MWPLKIKPPRIVVPFKDKVDPDRIKYAFTKGCDIAEIRVDLFASFAPDYVLNEVLKFRNNPSILTIRSQKEGGRFKGNEMGRLELYRQLITGVDAIDIELSASDILDEVVNVSQSRKKTIIVSYHNFDKTPDLNRLNTIIQDSIKIGGNIVKIATMINGKDDIRTLVSLLIDNPTKNLVVIGMGNKGKITRLLFPAFGSVMTFAQLDKETAPGQVDLETMVYDIYRYL